MESPPKESEHCSSGFDRTINRLPDDVIDKILTSLPIVEAAKAAVFSKNWNRGWRNISELKLDSSFGEKFEKAGRANLMLAICRILFLHSGTIDKFTLSIPWLESCAEINPFVQFLSDKKVKHLSIRFFNGDGHVLPSYLFSCFHLSTLVLAKCVLNLPRNFGGFSELTTLDLCDVDVTNDFGMFISNCPLLRQVRLVGCSCREVSSVNITSPNLRTFYCLWCNLIVFFVSAPQLNQLTLDACNLSEESPKCLLQLKDLTVGHVLFADIMKVSSLAGLIRSSPNIERLAICTNWNDDTAEVLEPEEYYFSCNNLQTVELYYFHSSNAMAFIKALLLKSPQLQEMTVWDVEVLSLIGLIRCSPGLKRLKIWAIDCAACDFINHEEEYDFPCNRLQTVELCKFFGTNAEMMFVKAMLLKSPQLKEMTIRGVDEKKELQILRKMIGFRRASVDVVIKLYLKI